MAETTVSGLANNHDFKLAGTKGGIADTDAAFRANSGYIIADFPADDAVFAAIQNDQKANFYFKEKLAEVTAENYDMKWYVLKKEGDCWHIDGVLVKKIPSYGIFHQYVSGTDGMELPAAITTDRIPADNRTFHEGETVTLLSLSETPAVGTIYQVKDGENVAGFWTLKSRIPDSAIMTGNVSPSPAPGSIPQVPGTSSPSMIIWTAKRRTPYRR